MRRRAVQHRDDVGQLVWVVVRLSARCTHQQRAVGTSTSRRAGQPDTLQAAGYGGVVVAEVAHPGAERPLLIPPIEGVSGAGGVAGGGAHSSHSHSSIPTAQNSHGMVTR